MASIYSARAATSAARRIAATTTTPSSQAKAFDACSKSLRRPERQAQPFFVVASFVNSHDIMYGDGNVPGQPRGAEAGGAVRNSTAAGKLDLREDLAFHASGKP